VGAFTYLPAISVIAPYAPGAWVFNAPVWGNPALGSRDNPRRGLEADFEDLFGLNCIHTIGDVARCTHAVGGTRSLLGGVLSERAPPMLRSTATRRFESDVVRGLWGLVGIGVLPVPLRGGLQALTRLDELTTKIPPEWLHAAQQVLNVAGGPAAAPSAAEAWAILARGLGWMRTGAPPLPLTKLTVRLATELQLRQENGAYDQLLKKHKAFICDALAVSGQPVPEEAPEHEITGLGEVFTRLWKLKWENDNKEAFWRLAVNGFSGFGMHGTGAAAAQCPCGVQMEWGDRRHHFWDCLLATVLRSEMEFEIFGDVEPDESELGKEELWLVRAPEGINQVVWDVVCLAAISALEHGRRFIYASRQEENRIATFERGRLAVVSEFWARLGSFASTGNSPRGWDTVPLAHPFLHRTPEGGIESHRNGADLQEVMEDADDDYDETEVYE
jgi:hypothetical protein